MLHYLCANIKAQFVPHVETEKIITAKTEITEKAHTTFFGKAEAQYVLRAEA